MRKQSAILSLITILIFHCWASQLAADIAYDLQPYVNFNSNNWELTSGTIITDGTLGEITGDNVIDWSINYQSNERVFNLTPTNSVSLFFNDAAGGLTATSTQLLMVGTADIAGNPEQLLFLEPTPSLRYGVAYFASEPSSLGGVGLFDSQTNPQRADESVSGGQTFLIGTASVPEPGSSAILAVGIAILFGRRIKRST